MAMTKVLRVVLEFDLEDSEYEKYSAMDEGELTDLAYDVILGCDDLGFVMDEIEVTEVDVDQRREERAKL